MTHSTGARLGNLVELLVRQFAQAPGWPFAAGLSAEHLQATLHAGGRKGVKTRFLS
jgi:hypothetical protein